MAGKALAHSSTVPVAARMPECLEERMGSVCAPALFQSSYRISPQ
jgi:hypothetical protein